MIKFLKEIEAKEKIKFNLIGSIIFQSEINRTLNKRGLLEELEDLLDFMKLLSGAENILVQSN